MHFPKFLAALGLMLGLAAESLARESIYFFNEAGWNGDNLFEKINVGECRAIPDSNAKGDSGSSVWVCVMSCSNPIDVLALAALGRRKDFQEREKKLTRVL